MFTMFQYIKYFIIKSRRKRRIGCNLSVKTVRQSADSSNIRSGNKQVIMGMTSATTNGATKSGSSTIPNSTTNLDLPHAKRNS
jgi:hypothetical protein